MTQRANVTQSTQNAMRIPGEWAHHESVWLAWPAAKDLWEEDLPAAQKEFADLCRAIQISEKSEHLQILVRTEAEELEARAGLKGLRATFHRIPYGDIWLRDTAPIFECDPETGAQKANVFQFNGWGGKYLLPGDDRVAARIAETSKLPLQKWDFVLEGGSIEMDGVGNLLTTEECLLNPNRNPGVTRESIEEKLRESLGVKYFLWLKRGLLLDHTDGHIDNLARFVRPNEIVIMKPSSKDDIQYEVLEEIRALFHETAKAGCGLMKVHEITSPGSVYDSEREIMPASYMNFYIANESVVVPQYGTPNDAEALRILQSLFKTRKVIGSSSKAILTGGGSFHCITQQVPSLEGRL